MGRVSADDIGEFGEQLVAVELSRPVRRRSRCPLFRARHLGDKYPTVDFIVEVLLPSGLSGGFFFAQVKSTGHHRASVRPRLPVAVSKSRFNALVKLPAPTYVIGVDVNSERSYVVAAHKVRAAAVATISKAFNLRDDAVKSDLYREVRHYWQENRPTYFESRFVDAR